MAGDVTEEGEEAMNKFWLAPGAVLGVLMLVLSAGCSSQQSGVTMNGSEATRGDCTVDLKEICDSMMNRMTHTDFTMNQENYDERSYEQNRPRHDDLIFPYNYPGGTLLASVRCQFDTVHHKVTSATLAGGPPIDDKAIAYIRSQGFCGDQSPDYEKAMNAAPIPSPSPAQQ